MLHLNPRGALGGCLGGETEQRELDTHLVVRASESNYREGYHSVPDPDGLTHSNM